MFTEGQRVRLVATFNNEPGTIEAATRGTVQHSDGVFVFVKWDNVESLLVHDQEVNEEFGLPMYSEEIEALDNQ